MSKETVALSLSLATACEAFCVPSTISFGWRTRMFFYPQYFPLLRQPIIAPRNPSASGGSFNVLKRLRTLETRVVARVYVGDVSCSTLSPSCQPSFSRPAVSRERRTYWNASCIGCVSCRRVLAQSCFKGDWGRHKAIHKLAKEKAAASSAAR